MHAPITVPAAHARCLVDTIDAIRGETLSLKAAGVLSVSADDLLDGGATAHAWLADLDAETESACGGSTTSADILVDLPTREPWQLQHLVYSLSAVLVWAHELRVEGRLATTLPSEAMAAWSAVEKAAGLSGRTSVALGLSAARAIGVAVHVDLDSGLVVETSSHAA